MDETAREAKATGAPGSALRVVWIATGALSVGIGAAGMVLPLLPTTPFVIFAAWCFAQLPRGC